MSLRAKIEAVVYAAEEPVTLAQLAAVFAPEVREIWLAEKNAEQDAELAAAESCGDARRGDRDAGSSRVKRLLAEASRGRNGRRRRSPDSADEETRGGYRTRWRGRQACGTQRGARDSRVSAPGAGSVDGGARDGRPWGGDSRDCRRLPDGDQARISRRDPLVCEEPEASDEAKPPGTGDAGGGCLQAAGDRAGDQRDPRAWSRPACWAVCFRAS